MKALILLLLLSVAVSAYGGDKQLYDLSVPVATPSFKQLLAGMDVWSSYVDKNNVAHYRVYLTEQQRAFFGDFSVVLQKVTRPEEKTETGVSSGRYLSLNEIYAALYQMEATRPDIAKIYQVGTTYEQRPILALKISTAPEINDPVKTEVFYVGVHHAREWISAMVPLELAQFILDHYTDNRRVYDMVNHSEIWILPVLNADGYAYTWKKDGDRLWRKNRQDVEVEGEQYIGIDPNRNYSFLWGGDGASHNPDSEVYCGQYPFDAAESQAVRNLAGEDGRLPPMNGWTDGFDGIISYHSYSQLILYPYGAMWEDSPKHILMSDIAVRIAELIEEQTAKQYTPQKSSELYLAAGDTTDWYHYYHNFKSAFTIELRPGADDPIAFELPASEIAGTVQENIPPALYYLENLLFDNPFIDTDVNDNNIVDYYEIETDIFNSPIALDYEARGKKKETPVPVNQKAFGCSLVILP